MIIPNPLSSHAENLVLHVEDDRFMRAVVESALVSNGYQVESAGDGLEGLTAFIQHRQTLSLILTDLDMPRCNGLQFVRAIRTEDPHIPIVVMSGSGDETSVDELRKLGVGAFLRKPCRLELLLTTIAESIDSVKTHDSVK